MTREILHKRLYFYLLILLAVSIPVSEFLMSLSQMLLALNWLIEGKFRKKYRNIVKNKGVLFFILLFLLHFIWLINTSDFHYGLSDLRVKLPLLTLPVLIGSSDRLQKRQLKILLLFFVTSVIVASLIISYLLFGFSGNDCPDPRNASIFISHIRFALMVVFSIFILGHYIINDFRKFTIIEKGIYLLGFIWLIVFTYFFRSLTGIILLGIIGFIILLIHSFRIRHVVLRLFLVVVLVTAFLVVISSVVHIIAEFNKKEDVNLNNLDKQTESGNYYSNNINSKLIENGHYVWIYYCEKELKKEWNKRSDFEFDGYDNKNQKIKYILVRYLTSKGLRKDSAGLAQLTDKDIENIENGMANYIYERPYSLRAIIYNVYWQIQTYISTGNIQGFSLIQRIEYLKTAKNIIKQHFWFGTGTGDVKQSFKDQYIKQNSTLPEKQRRRAHNQLVTFWVSFGILGFLISLMCLTFPFILKKHKNILFLVFFLIVFSSMFTEDTLETQSGITFVVFFYCIFISSNINEISNNGKTK